MYWTRISTALTVLTYCILVYIPITVNTANILVLDTLVCHSHAMWFNVITTVLAQKHNVIVLSADREKIKIANRTTYELETSYEHDAYEVLDLEGYSTYFRGNPWKSLLEWDLNNCEIQKTSKGLQNLLNDVVKSKVKIDLIIREGAAGDCFLPLIHLLNYPRVITASAFPNLEWVNDLIGNHANPSFVPNSMLLYSDQMTFSERFYNLYMDLNLKILRKYWYLPKVNEVAKEIFGPNVPHVRDLERIVDLAFVNYNPITDYAKPTVPAHISVPGIQLKPPQQLPEDIQIFLDEAHDGVILFTLGSSLLTKNMKPAYKKMFFDVFSKLKQRVIWKWEEEIPTDKPSNVMLRKWLPQADILGHRNTIAFISHCGQAGVQEAIYHSVPVVAMPFFIDQYVYAQKLKNWNVSIKMNYEELTEDSVQNVLGTITNPQNGYMERMEKLSSLYRDIPEQSIDKIVFWTDYVLKHGGTHLIPMSNQLNVFQYYLLDIIFSILLTPIVLYYCTKYLMKICKIII